MPYMGISRRRAASHHQTATPLRLDAPPCWLTRSAFPPTLRPLPSALVHLPHRVGRPERVVALCVRQSTWAGLLYKSTSQSGVTSHQAAPGTSSSILSTPVSSTFLTHFDLSHRHVFFSLVQAPLAIIYFEPPLVPEHAHWDLHLGRQRRTSRDPRPKPRGSANPTRVRQQVGWGAVRLCVAVPHDARRATYEHCPASRAATCAPFPSLPSSPPF
jgi:hypothetical protein